jgi:hypothetical protein
MTEATQRQTFRLVVNGDQARESIAGEVRAELARQHVSDAEVAACLGQNQQWFNRRKNGQVAFRADELAVVAAYLGVEVGQFFGRVISAPTPGGDWWAPRGSNPQPTDYKSPVSVVDLAARRLERELPAPAKAA